MANKKSYVSPELELFNVKAEERIAAAGCTWVSMNFGEVSGCSITEGFYGNFNEGAATSF